jgi:hypothetical protein
VIIASVLDFQESPGSFANGLRWKEKLVFIEATAMNFRLIFFGEILQIGWQVELIVRTQHQVNSGQEEASSGFI